MTGSLKYWFSRLIGARIFGIGLTIQAVLSAGSFIVGLILIRNTEDLQYSYYILAYNAILFVTAGQQSIVQPTIVTGIAQHGLERRRDLIGGLLRGSHRWIPLLCVAVLLFSIGIWAGGWISGYQLILAIVFVLVSAAALGRDLYRMILLGYRRPADVLVADIVFSAVLIVGVFLSTHTPHPALIAVGVLGVASLTGRIFLGRALWRYEPWNRHAALPSTREVMDHGIWSFTGATIHWLLIQGYGYVAASFASVREVAALAGTRLTLSPIFVLSSGVSMLLLPMTAHWLQEHGPRVAFRRLLMLVATLAVLALGYVLLLWVLRDWIFNTVLHKQFLERDRLLVLWSAVFMTTLCRDQLASLLAARRRFRMTATVTAISVLVWAIASYVAMQFMGAIGAVVGILVGELMNLSGIVALTIREIRLSESPGADG